MINIFKKRYLKFSILAAALFSILNAFAQNQVQPLFKHITYVDYEIKKSAKSQHIVIKTITEIDATGLVNFKSIFYNGVADTTYRLSDQTIATLNKYFNGSKIKKYQVRSKLEHQGGDLSYLAYTSKNNKSDETIIVDSFMDDDFYKTLLSISIAPRKANKKVKSINNPVIEQKISKCIKATPDLPIEEEPPPALN